MKKLLVVIITLFSINSFAMEYDKQLHLEMSFFISAQSYLVCRSFGQKKLTSAVIATAVTLSLGVAKELSDDHFDKQDLKYDAIGTVLAPLILIGF